MDNKRIGPVPHAVLVVLLSTSLVVSAQPMPQNNQSASSSSKQVADNGANQAPGPGTSAGIDSGPAPVGDEPPDAPSAVQPVQQGETGSSTRPQESNSVPSGAAGAKAPSVRGAPASRTVGAAIAPAKQKQHRSMLIKVGLVAGACVAVGSALALSKGSPSKPPGAP